MASEGEREPGLEELRAALEAEGERSRRLEEALRAAEEHNRLVLEGVKDFAIFGLDQAGRITSWNEGARRMLGYSADEAVGQFTALTFTPEDRTAGKPENEIEQARTRGSAVDENWAQRKDGSRFWASGFLTALPAQGGKPPAFIKIFRDLTERRQAEEALRESRLRLHTALAAARMGTWLLDLATGRDTIDDNLRQLLGLPRGAAVRSLDDFLALIHPDDRAAVAGAFARSAREGVSLSIEFRVVWPDGSVHWLRDQGDVLKDVQGRPVGLTGACVEITERKRMEEELRRAHDELERRVEERTAELREAQHRALRAERLAAIGQTVAGLAHEGRNALQAIQACSERLAWRLEDQPEALGLVGEIQKARETLARLFDDVRGFAAPIHIDRRPCDLAGVWRQAWARVTALHPGREAQLREETNGLDLTCEADAFRLGQVFFNVLDNALAAVPGPVHVAITCAAAELAGRPALRVAVRDDGPGLGAEQRQKIFEPFYTTKTHGTGLGMAIAKRIVEAHEGALGVGEGDPGAEIIITLPRRKS